MGAHFGSLLRENSISVSAKNEVFPAWEFNSDEINLNVYDFLVFL